MSFDVHQLDTFVLIGAAVTLLAILAVRISSRAGLPSLLIYLLMGIVLGEAGFGIQFEDAELAHALGFAALAVILAEGGLTTSWSEVRPSMRARRLPRDARRGRVGDRRRGGRPLRARPVLGAGDPPGCGHLTHRRRRGVLRAAVVPLPKRLVGTLEVESGLNDAPTVVLVTLVSTGALQESGALAIFGTVAFELVVGVASGLVFGYGGGWLLRRSALPASGLYPIAVLCLAFVGYGVASALHGSGFAAVYVAALILGNSEFPHRGATRSFAEGIAWLAQIGLFVMLGLLFSPGRITFSTARPRGGWRD